MLQKPTSVSVAKLHFRILLGLTSNDIQKLFMSTLIQTTLFGSPLSSGKRIIHLPVNTSVASIHVLSGTWNKVKKRQWNVKNVIETLVIQLTFSERDVAPSSYILWLRIGIWVHFLLWLCGKSVWQSARSASEDYGAGRTFDVGSWRSPFKPDRACAPAWHVLNDLVITVNVAFPAYISLSNKRLINGELDIF